MTHIGVKTGGIRKIPLIRVTVDKSYVLIGSYAGSPQHPVWVYNLRANPDVEIRDGTEVFKMRVREVVDDPERQRLWDISGKAFPPYIEYQEKNVSSDSSIFHRTGLNLSVGIKGLFGSDGTPVLWGKYVEPFQND